MTLSLSLSPGALAATRRRPTHVLVIDELHQLELSVGALGVGHVLEGSGQLLDGDALLGDVVVGGAAGGRRGEGVSAALGGGGSPSPAPRGERHLPDDALSAGADRFEVGVAAQDRESGVSDLDGVEEPRGRGAGGHSRAREGRQEGHKGCGVSHGTRGQGESGAGPPAARGRDRPRHHRRIACQDLKHERRSSDERLRAARSGPLGGGGGEGGSDAPSGPDRYEGGACVVTATPPLSSSFTKIGP